MPIQLRLSDDQNYLIYEFTDPLTIDELMRAYKQEKTHRDSIPHVVHSIVDMSGMKRIPANWLTAKAGPGFTHPRSGEIVFAGLSVGMTMIVSTILKIVKYKRMKFFRTRPEADAYMKELVARTAPQPAQSGSAR